MVIVKNIQLNFIWAIPTPTKREAPARAIDAIKGDLRDKSMPITNISSNHKIIQYQ